MSGASIPEELVDLLEGGVSVFVATRDVDMRPEPARAVGASVSADRKRVTVFLPESTSARTVENLRASDEIAVGFSRPFDNLAIQVKGRCLDLHLATEAERTTPQRYHGAFVEQLYLIGIPRSIATRMSVWPAWAVTLEVRDIFVQTPGPGAGKRL